MTKEKLESSTGFFLQVLSYYALHRTHLGQLCKIHISWPTHSRNSESSLTGGALKSPFLTGLPKLLP